MRSWIRIKRQFLTFIFYFFCSSFSLLIFWCLKIFVEKSEGNGLKTALPPQSGRSREYLSTVSGKKLLSQGISNKCAVESSFTTYEEEVLDVKDPNLLFHWGHCIDLDQASLWHWKQLYVALLRSKMDSSNNDDTTNDNTLSFFDIEALPGNMSCVDCNAEDPDWASLGFGVLICLHCAGHHRSLGVHISLVRSLNLDSWSAAQLSHLRNGGNETFKAHISTCFSSSGANNGTESQRDLFEGRYNNPEVLYYK